MWKEDKLGMRILLDKVDKKEFNITEADGLYLIHPKKNKWNWKKDELWLRSIIIDKDGYIKSCSFPKFGNYGEIKADSKKLDEVLESGGTVRYTHKEDGSLCIRSVINGKVIFRTRGTIYGGVEHDGVPSFGDKFRDLANSKYKILLNPNWMSDVTLLFEYVSPDNKIVVNYTETNFIFIGAVEHFKPKLWRWESLEDLSRKFNLNLVRTYELPRKLKDLIDVVRTWDDEGVVIRINNDQTFVKIKSTSYLIKHRLKSNINYSTLYEIILSSKIENEDLLVKYLQKNDYDWELIEAAKVIYSEISENKEKAEGLFKEAKEKYEEFIQNSDTRKDFALKAIKEKPNIKTFLFLLYDNKENEIHNKLQQLVKNRFK